VRFPDRFRQSIAPAAGQNNLDSPLQADPVSRRNKDRNYPVFGAEDHSDHPLVEKERNLIASAFSHVLMMADQPFFPQPMVGRSRNSPRCEAKPIPPRMSNALTVENDRSGFCSRRQTPPEGQAPPEVSKPGI